VLAGLARCRVHAPAGIDQLDPEVLKPYLSGDLGYYWSPLRLVKLTVMRPALFAPGTSARSSYSSTNYHVLGLIVGSRDQVGGEGPGSAAENRRGAQERVAT
jgi:hypothetical protein